MRNMMKLLVIFTIGFIALNALNANSIDHKKVNMKDINELKEKRGIIGGAIIVGGITAGASLLGIAAIKGLMSTGYSVAVAGSIENYSKWAMIFERCEVAHGAMNKPMLTVHPGKKEGFAAHKSWHSLRGSWVYCTYRVSDRRVHIMYSVPFSFKFYTNWLALAITMPHVTLSAHKMYYKHYSFMARRQYYYSVAPTKICDDTFCIMGTMGSSHKPEIKIKLYPRHFYDLSHSCKNFMRHAWHKNDGRQYSKFIENAFLNRHSKTVIIQ